MENPVTAWVDSMLNDARIVRLYSNPILSPIGEATADVFKGTLKVHDHHVGAQQMAHIFGCSVDDLPDGLGWQTETLSLNTHEPTHVDAPVHYRPRLADGSPALGIDAFPAEQFIGHAVVLDVRGFPHGAPLVTEQIRGVLQWMDYSLRQEDIVLLLTGADKHLGQPDYLEYGVGLSPGAVNWLRDQGIRALGTDAFTIDEPFPQMIRSFKVSGNPEVIWPAHYSSDTLIHYEKLANLEQLPPIGALFVGPPIPLKGASAGPANPVGIVPKGLAAIGER
jgi:kynurenine formamidase